MKNLDYGPVYVTGGPFKGRVMCYDDDEDSTAICYAGSLLDFVRCYGIPARFLREPLIDDLIKRQEEIAKIITEHAVTNEWPLDVKEIHELWSEKSVIEGLLYERRMLGAMRQPITQKTIFLCHSSSDKGFVRMVNDDLCRLGAETWMDENHIKVGDSIVGKVADGLKACQFMAVFMSPEAVNSLWAKREWQSFLARQLAGSTITILPILVENCEIPPILADLKYADFSVSYHDGLKALHEALT